MASFVFPHPFLPCVGLLLGSGETLATPNPTRFILPLLGWAVDARLLLGFGFTAQVLFTARQIVQGLDSMRRGESYTPPSFWYLSLVAGALLAFYFFARSDPVGLLQQVLMAAIYMRNIYMIRKEQRGERFHRHLAKSLSAVCALLGLFLLLGAMAPGSGPVNNVHDPDLFKLPFFALTIRAELVLAFGYLGAGIFMSRFIVQWIVSERAGRSVVPKAFWVLASIGTVMLLIYFSVRSDPVAILGQVATLPIYLYNLSLMRRAERQAA